MKRLLAIAAIALCGTALADWNPGDPNTKWAQLPDRNGWDVRLTLPAPQPPAVADDFLCTQTGPITDVHLWISMRGDQPTPPIQSLIDISFWSDVPAGAGQLPYSTPGQLLWDRIFTPQQFTVRTNGTGLQGWYDPFNQLVLPNNHQQTWQLNLVDIQQPFVQQDDTVYWLGVSFEPGWGEAGWKTSTDHWGDDAVWWNFNAGGWTELSDPRTQHSLDMAFVLTSTAVPEPATMAMNGIMLVGLGLGGLWYRRAKKQKA